MMVHLHRHGNAIDIGRVIYKLPNIRFRAYNRSILELVAVADDRRRQIEFAYVRCRIVLCSDESFMLSCNLFVCLFYRLGYICTVVTILCFVGEQRQLPALESAVCAIARKVRVVVREELARSCGIASKSGRRRRNNIAKPRIIGCRLVGRCPMTLTAPFVAGLVMLPKRIIGSPYMVIERHVRLARIDGGRWQPFYIREHIRLGDELPHLGRAMGALYGGVVLGAQPTVHMMIDYTRGIGAELLERFYIALVIEKPRCDVASHTVGFERSEHIGIRFELPNKIVVTRRRGIADVDCPSEYLAHLFENSCVYLILRVDTLLTDIAQRSLYDALIERKGALNGIDNGIFVQPVD